MDKARESLKSAKATLSIKLATDAGRHAYYTEFHCAKAFLFEQTGRVVKTHGGVHREFRLLAKDTPELCRYVDTLNRSYDLKSVADYETGPHATTSFSKAADAIETATEFMDAVVSVIGP